jgi:hypothetical protein
MPDATIDGKATKPIPARTQAAIKQGMPLHKALSTTTSPRSTIKVGS